MSTRWRALLRHPTDPTLMNRRQLEVCLLSYLGDHLQDCQIYGGHAIMIIDAILRLSRPTLCAVLNREW